MIRHRLSLASTHRRTVTAEVTLDLAPGTGSVDVTFPVWTPGSYLIREHSRQRIGLSIRQATDMPLLPVAATHSEDALRTWLRRAALAAGPGA